MITKLKSRPRLDALDNQRRGAGKKLGRRVYFGILIAIFVSITYFFIGARFVLDADGLVVKDRFLLAAEYDSRVIRNNVQPGDAVRKGQTLLLLDSRDIANKLSDFDARRSELLNQLEEVSALIASAERLLPIASAQEKQARDYAEKVQKLLDSGFTTTPVRNNAMDVYFARQRDVAALNGERVSALKREKTITSTLAELDGIIADTKRIFDQGTLESPVDGIVGPVVPSIGQVNKRGEPIMEMFVGTPYVLAYLPTDRVYAVEVGTKVAINDGYRTARGRIVKIGGLTDNLPAEFQGTLKRRERQEILKIEFDGNPGFVLGSTVSITSSFGPTGIIDRIRTALFGDGIDPIDTAAVGPSEATVEQGDRPMFSPQFCDPCGETYKRLTSQAYYPQKLERTAND
jgi:multidrug resistance efflux pump